MNESIYYLSDKIENKYNVYLNYDICEIISEKINYNMFQINYVRNRLKSKINRLNKLLNNKSPKVFDSYLLHKKKEYKKILLNIDNNTQTRYNILNNIDIYDDE
tara:strand:+ start:1504 stop:1815 length:312 start_codon:yes stop_codon:yes gene_type:complete